MLGLSDCAVCLSFSVVCAWCLVLTYVFNIPLVVVCWGLFGCGFAVVRVALVLVFLCGCSGLDLFAWF